MSAKKKPIVAVLRRHGISDDPRTFLDKKGANAGVSKSRSPDVHVRGTVQLMKKDRTITREQVAKGFRKLKYL